MNQIAFCVYSVSVATQFNNIYEKNSTAFHPSDRVQN